MKTLTEQYILKSRTGVYQDTSENRRLHRVGQHYGEHKAEEGSEARPSKREQREARLAKYKGGVERLDAAIKSGKFSARQMEQAYELKTQLEAKISKLEAKLARGRKSADKTNKPEEKKRLTPLHAMPMNHPTKSSDKELFEGLTKEQKTSILDKYRQESESMLRQENMNPDLVIGAIEEFESENLWESDDVMDLAEELNVSKNKAIGIIRHALRLEKKRLEGLGKEPEKKSDDEQEPSWDKQDAFFKKGTDEYELLDDLDHYLKRRDPFYQREMQKIFEKKFPNIDEWKLTSPNTGRAEIRAIVDGKEVASINLNDAGEKSTIPMLQTFMDKCQKAEKKSEVKAPAVPPNYDFPGRGKNVDFMMGDVHVKIENPTQYASDGKDIYRVTISKDGKQVEQVASAVPATIKKVIEKYGSGNKSEDFEAFAEKFEKNYRRNPNRTVPTKSSEIRELARKEWEKMKS